MILFCYEETDMSKFFFSKDVGGEKNPNKVVSYLVWTDAYKEANPNHSITTKFMAKRKFATWFKENYHYELDYSEGNDHISILLHPTGSHPSAGNQAKGLQWYHTHHPRPLSPRGSQ